ncbi:MAG TPA: DUF3887 domain-containing protein [Steroidobacteraceae bacterium]|nr:DUF3887 domain-containing protein [Steroidobacteraceae bacterium]
MTTDRRRTSVVFGLALALLVPVAQAAGDQAAKGSLVPEAVSFVRALAKGDFEAAEADFTDQMKQAAPPAKLGEVWQRLISQVGPFQDTGDSKTVVQNGFTTVVVRTDFKSRALGIAVTFDSAQRIAGMHFVPPP